VLQPLPALPVQKTSLRPGPMAPSLASLLVPAFPILLPAAFVVRQAWLEESAWQAAAAGLLPLLDWLELNSL